jgi:hypothetical protein
MPMSSRSLVLTGVLALGSLLCAIPAAADPMRILLKDGSVVTGELVAVQSGRLVVKSTSLGLVEIDQTRVASMAPLALAAKTPAPAPASPAPSGPNKDVAAAVQSLMATDPEALSQLSKLKESALMKEILSDPDLMAKISAGDYAALAEDPRIKKLLEDETIRSLTKRAGG